ncbi:MAG: DUF4142 domain-containing protein [Nitrospirota bacterium]|nr:DUF4142 domain-containing protein [Nitrospirota bacterium]
MRLTLLVKILFLNVAVVVLAISGMTWTWGGSGKHHSLTPILDDKAIFAIFEQFNTYDIELANIAAIKGESDSVRHLAGMIITDHPKLQQQARDLAAKLGISYAVTVSNHYASEHQRQVAELQAKSGTDFDKAYLKHEIRFSREVVHSVKHKLIPAAQHQELKQLLSETLPQLEHHVAHMIDTAEQIGMD